MFLLMDIWRGTSSSISNMSISLCHVCRTEWSQSTTGVSLRHIQLAWHFQAYLKETSRGIHSVWQAIMQLNSMQQPPDAQISLPCIDWFVCAPDLVKQIPQPVSGLPFCGSWLNVIILRNVHLSQELCIPGSRILTVLDAFLVALFMIHRTPHVVHRTTYSKQSAPHRHCEPRATRDLPWARPRFLPQGTPHASCPWHLDPPGLHRLLQKWPAHHLLSGPNSRWDTKPWSKLGHPHDHLHLRCRCGRYRLLQLRNLRSVMISQIILNPPLLHGSTIWQWDQCLRNLMDHYLF